MKKWIVLVSFTMLSMLAVLMTGQIAAAAPQLQSGTLAVSPATAAQSAVLGNLVQYNLTVTNNAAAEALVNTAISGNTWQTSVSPAQLTLAAGAQGSVTVTVVVPGNVANGSTDAATITFVSGLDASTAAATLTTTALNPTATPQPGVLRPLVVLNSYTTGAAVRPGNEFDLSLNLKNTGQRTATNMVISFESADFLPRSTGGVLAVANLDAGNTVSVTQPMLASMSLWGYPYGTLNVKISYNDSSGGAYSETFVLTINLVVPAAGGTTRPTATPTQIARPQLVVSGYTSDVDPLQPGTIFTLGLDVRNLGTADARSITMVLGGTANLDASGTPTAGGISGASGDLTYFAPIGSSNLVFLGDLAAGAELQASQKLIVNVANNPGAYPFKISFVYTDARGVRTIDDQVITLLIYSLPQVEVSFYRDPGMFFVGQMTTLPLQVNNLGKKTAVLGNLKVTAANGDLTNNTSLVGTLDPGGYFTLDANLVPMLAGPLELTFTINYSDDFNQPREIVQTMTVDVQDIPMEPTMVPGTEGSPDGGIPVAQPETFWQKVVRFFRGLFGLGSAQETPTPIPGMEPTPTEAKPVIIPGGKG